MFKVTLVPVEGARLAEWQPHRPSRCPVREEYCVPVCVCAHKRKYMLSLSVYQ